MLPFLLQRKTRQQEVCNKFYSDFRHIVQPRDKIKSTRGRQVHAKFPQGKLEGKKKYKSNCVQRLFEISKDIFGLAIFLMSVLLNSKSKIVS